MLSNKCGVFALLCRLHSTWFLFGADLLQSCKAPVAAWLGSRPSRETTGSASSKAAERKSNMTGEEVIIVCIQRQVLWHCGGHVVVPKLDLRQKGYLVLLRTTSTMGMKSSQAYPGTCNSYVVLGHGQETTMG